MESSLKRLTELTALVTKYTEELSLLESQSQCFALECQNVFYITKLIDVNPLLEEHDLNPKPLTQSLYPIRLKPATQKRAIRRTTIVVDPSIQIRL